jgi:FG-GAP-like repeat/Secretion system C-terminal sorting domain
LLKIFFPTLISLIGNFKKKSMKTKKILYNGLLLQYNQSIGKLNRLIEKGLNIRKQDILKRRIKKIYDKLISFIGSFKKTIALGATIGGMFVNTQLSAQSFLPAVVNPYSISINQDELGYKSRCSFADLDGDGDLDLMVGDSYFDFRYFKNNGTATSPNFEAPILNPFSLVGVYDFTDLTYLNFSFADIDGDGDFDIMAGNSYGKFYYYENTGGINSPNFSLPSENVFSLNSPYNYSSATFADLDADGDLDMISGSGYSGFQYFKNDGISTNPIFASSVNNPFGLMLPNVPYNSCPSLGDLDGDGDFDMISAFDYGTYFAYYENIGTSLIPQFAESLINPFSIEEPADYLAGASSTLVDLDGDGDLDLVSGSIYGNIYYFENANCNPISTTVIAENGILTVDETLSATYQWLDCENGNSTVLGETDQVFNVSVAGSYAVEIDLGSGCKDTSQCYIVTACELLDEPVNTNVTVDGATFTAEQADAAYQWRDCSDNTDIEGETEQSFTPTESGSYQVSIDVEGCLGFSECIDISICEGGSFSTTINSTLDSLTAEQTDALYQWIDCSTLLAITGDTNQTFVPTITGDYAVEITLGTCVDTSVCVPFYVCDGSTVDAEIVQEGDLLSIVVPDLIEYSAFQWLDCDSLNLPIANQILFEYSPMESGSFAVIVNFNGCTATTECYDFTFVGIEENLLSNKIQVYPNPMQDKLNLILDKPLNNAIIEVKSITGQVVFEQKNTNGSNFLIDITNQVGGLYFLQISESGYTTRTKFIKE